MPKDIIIGGIDEAGRGPLAGPVTASAVVFHSAIDITFLNDSKKMTEKKRITSFYEITKHSFFGIGWASNEEIDKINILQATFLAMKRAFNILYNNISKKSPNLLERLEIIVDGNIVPNLETKIPVKALIKADASIPEVMASSILAKVARDKMMVRYSWLYPEWGYEKHKGYGTKAHKEAIKKHGMSPIQRLSFKSL